MKKNIFLVNLFLFCFFYIAADILFSNFIYTYKVGYKCYKHNSDGSFYELDKNCYAQMRLLSSIESYKVFTNKFGLRFSGIKNYSNSSDSSIFFFGDSQAFGVGSDWENTFVGMIEKKLTNYKIYNFGVPSYSPSVHYHKLKEFLKTNQIRPDKIFIVLDLTDVMDESNRWTNYNKEEKPFIDKQKTILKKNSFFKKFKKENLKGSILISNHVRKYSRKLRKNFTKEIKNENNYSPVNGTLSGGFIYSKLNDIADCDIKLKRNLYSQCENVKYGLKKIEQKLIKINNLSKKINSELYIVTFPWPDTLNFGQTEFDWEKFVYNLCELSNCNDVINLFPKFFEIKKTNKNWLQYIYLNNDIHLTTAGNKIVAEKILEIAF